MATPYTPHVQVGFDLRTVKHYGTPDNAVKQVTKAMQGWINDGVAFNIIVVAQLQDTLPDTLRYVPLLNCFRGGPSNAEFQARVYAARVGFTCFA